MFFVPKRKNLQGFLYFLLFLIAYSEDVTIWGLQSSSVERWGWNVWRGDATSLCFSAYFSTNISVSLDASEDSRLWMDGFTRNDLIRCTFTPLEWRLGFGWHLGWTTWFQLLGEVLMLASLGFCGGFGSSTNPPLKEPLGSRADHVTRRSRVWRTTRGPKGQREPPGGYKQITRSQHRMFKIAPKSSWAPAVVHVRPYPRVNFIFFKATLKSWGHSDSKNYYESNNACVSAELERNLAVGQNDQHHRV